MKFSLTFVTKSVRIEDFSFQFLKEELNINYSVNLNNMQNILIIENLLHKELIYDRYLTFVFKSKTVRRNINEN